MNQRHACLLLLPVLLAGAWLGPRPGDGAGDEGELAAEGARTVIAVRHAEKEEGGGSDPGLSPVGQERAAELARMLSAAGVTHLFTSGFRRTRGTLEPLASASGLLPEEYDAFDLGALAARLRSLPAGSVAVVCGHSNTTPALVELLGGSVPGGMSEEEYDRLFVVSLPSEGCSEACSGGSPGAAIELRFGEPSPR